MRQIASRGPRWRALARLLVAACCTAACLSVGGAWAVGVDRPTVEVWSDRGDSGIYHSGDAILLFYRVGGDSYVHLFNVNVEGRVKLVFPNEWDRESYARRGRLYAIPARGTYRFMAGPPFGTEHLVAVATPDVLAPTLTSDLTREPVSDVAEFIARIETALSGLPRDKWNLAVTTLLMRP